MGTLRRAGLASPRVLAGSSNSVSAFSHFPGSSTSRLKVQGCISQAGCNLLNGTQEVGPISLWETCIPKGECHGDKTK